MRLLAEFATESRTSASGDAGRYRIEVEMQKPALLLMVPLFAFFGIASAQEAKTIRITPTWIKEHPKRIELSCGTAFSGRNDYFIKLVLEKKSVCRIHTTFVATKTDYEKKPPDLTMYETSMRTETPAKVVRLAFSENKPYSLKPIYRIATIVSAAPESPDYWIETGSYIVDLRDFDDLWDAFLATQKR